MKNIFKYLAVAFLAITALSCEDTDTQRIPSDFVEGPNVRISVDPAFGFINFTDLDNTFLRYDIFSNGRGISTIDIQMIWSTGGVPTDTAIVRSYTPADFAATGSVLDVDLSATALMEAMGRTTADIAGGDSFVFSNFTTMTDGRVYPDTTLLNNLNVSPTQIAAAATTGFSVGFTAFAGCPSTPSDFAGEYSSVITASNYGGFIGASNDVTITFIGPEPFRYNMSDMSALAYAPFGGTEYPGDFYDICGTPLALVTSTFGSTSDTGGGTWDLATGTLTLNYFEAFNGLSWTIVFTKK